MGLRDFSDQGKADAEQLETENENYAMSNNTGSFGLSGQEFTFNDPIPVPQQANQPFARISGVLFTGNIGFDQQTAKLDVVTNTINLLEDSSGNQLPRVSTDRTVTLSTGTTGTLTTILGSQRPGQRLTLYNIFGNTITITHTAAAIDNTILTPDTNNFIFSNNMAINLVWDIFTTKWRIVGSSGGTGGISEPIILGINTLTPLTSPTVTPIAWNTKNPQQITIDRNITFSFTDLPASGSYEGILVIIDINGTGGFDTPIWPSSVTNPPIVPTTANSRTSVMLYTINGGTTVTHATSVGSSTGGNFANQQLSNLGTTALNANLNMQGKELRFDTDKDTFIASLTDDNLQFAVGGTVRMSITNTGIVAAHNLSMSSATIDLDGNALILDQDGDSVISSPSDDSMQFATGGSIRMNLFNTGLVMNSDLDLNAKELFFDDDKDTIISAQTDDVLQIAVGGSVRMSITNTNIQMAHNLEMSSATIDLDGNSLILDQDQDTVISASVDDSMQFATGGSIRLAISNSLANFQVPIDMNHNTIQLDGQTPASVTNPPATERKIFVDSGTGELSVKTSAGGTVSLEASGTSSFIDNVFEIKDDGDNTKIAKFQCSAITTGTTRTYTLPDDSAGLVTVNTNAAFANKDFKDTTCRFVNTSIQTKTLKFDLAGATAATEMTFKSSHTAARILTFPDVTDTIAVLGKVQTWSAIQTHTANLIGNGTSDLGTTANPWNNIVSDNTLFCSNLKVFDTDGDINVFNDFDMQAGDTIDFADTSTTAGTSSQTLPAQPDGFIIIKVNGVSKRVPFYVP